MAKEIKKHILSVYDENGNKIPIPAIGSKDYKLPAASENKLGGIKAPAKTPDQTVPVGIGEDNKLYVAPSGEEQVQSDWAENDPQNPAYVKNRFGGYEDTTEEVIFPKQDITFEAGEFYDTTPLPEIGSNVRVNADGLDYESEVIDVSDIVGYGKAIGNLLFLGGPDTGEPYFIVDFGAEDGTDWITSFGDRTISVSLSAVSKTTVKIDPKYLPAPLPPITPDDESAFLQVTDGRAGWKKRSFATEDKLVGKKTAEGGEIFNSATSAGEDSHAEGQNTFSSGYASHAEGQNTTASSAASHAEGQNTTASGIASHAEGDYTTASGNRSHAEGYASHAEGDASHAEGIGSHAEGDASHAEGYYTEASGQYQHAQGRYNLPDTEDGTTTGVPKNKYAHVVGNGKYRAPSNAHTLDWDGNSWYQGNVLVGGKDMDAPDAGLLPDGVIIKSSTPGSVKFFKITITDDGAIKGTEFTWPTV